MTDKTFLELNLPKFLLKPLDELGYETPTPIQAASIPALLEKHDLLAQAQTGTGKTAAFALPTLAAIDTTLKAPQVLVVTPTRELAIQVAEAFQRYAQELKGFHVTAIYGGQDYSSQLRSLKRGVNVIVGTPGRLIDHLKRGTLVVDELKTVILDEADEMLKMGFIDDVQWIFEQIKHPHQRALFSATMPPSIKAIAKKYLNHPEEIYIKPTHNSVDLIDQNFIRVNGHQKMDLLTRILEVEPVTAAIIFARTKNASVEVAEKLQARGYAATALHGDMNQSLREKTIQRLKDGSSDIIVATDVAARGIDVERISHVINYDIPYDTESYVHRIGRTGRAGRTGKALLFVTPREFHLLRTIERVTKKTIKRIQPPTAKEIQTSRNRRIIENLIPILIDDNALNQYRHILDDIQAQTDAQIEDIALALIYQIQGPNSEVKDLVVDEPKKKKRSSKYADDTRKKSSYPNKKATSTNHKKYTKDKPKRRSNPVKNNRSGNNKSY
ncbi:DEAD/DEAH box helicase [Thiotrichales bacterium 19S3-7]|nr:DEAD/DEAH box helicase [Thiotrichales bacterium 19S3-7]MCF6801139.1 DEAD/DEAH box helicase [Thiotrichales bacterium 19S3-11]